MKSQLLFKQIEGIQTIKSIMALLNVNREKAIYLIHRLRKAGYVKTKKNKDGSRIYYVSLENKLGGISYYDIINAHSPVKITGPKYIIYGKKPSLEETLIFALKTKELRIILASLALFRNINNWSSLYQMAKKENLVRQVGALYDLARKYFMVRRMPERFKNHTLPRKGDKTIYIIRGLKSKDFKAIEKIWKIYLPFNEADLEDYK
ncbi:hypothetical protein HZA97_05765 [Candidatus Woesearchaeota archaeon]|nr:hypothetical protein [Candidatus Woesearchaeota archaeon]